LLSVVVAIIFFTVLDINFVDAAKTGGYNFCKAFPTYPECTGWRTEAIGDNFWFCEYVHLKNLCKNAPEPEKQIELRTQDYCCRYIGPELQKTKTNDSHVVSQVVLPSDTVESILPLIIWTDKDHYNYRDKVIVYGKFDFTNPNIKQNIGQTNFSQTSEISEKTFTVDIKLNGRIILRDIPVNSNGWFSSSFTHNNIYTFSTQSNFVEVEYIVTGKDIPLGGPKTHATYHFTTGDIAKMDDSFKVWIDKTSLPNKIEYGVIVKDPDRFIELSRNSLVITKLINSEGYTIPIESMFSIQNTGAEYKGFKEFGQGKYEIQITYGNNTAKETFEYID